VPPPRRPVRRPSGAGRLAKPTAVEPARAIAARALNHLLARIAATPALDQPFSHIYLDGLFPQDLYERMLAALPNPDLYDTAAERYRGDTGFVRRQLALTTGAVEGIPDPDLWRGIAAALTAPELKRAMFARLAPDLAYRYGIAADAVADLPGHTRPTLYRETDGFEIPPHPDTRKKIVTMHLYLPADESQVGLGTALYRRKLLALPAGPWRWRFERVKQFPFKPNSAYAFAVNNTVMKKSWHGRERLPAGCGVRNTLLNTFYAEPRAEYAGYLDPAAARQRAAA
jgi:hypothetical protein